MPPNSDCDVAKTVSATLSSCTSLPPLLTAWSNSWYFLLLYTYSYVHNIAYIRGTSADLVSSSLIDYDLATIISLAPSSLEYNILVFTRYYLDFRYLENGGSLGISSGVVWQCGHWTMDKGRCKQVVKREDDTDWKDLARWKIRIGENPHLPYHTMEKEYGGHD